MSGEELEDMVEDYAALTKGNMMNGNPHRIVRDHGCQVWTPTPIDMNSLPAEFKDADYDIVVQEQRLQGFWFKKMHPGYIAVCVETDHYAARQVAAYCKRWSETTWERKNLKALM